MPTLPDLLFYASTLLLGAGLVLVMSRSHAVAALIGVELLLNAALLNLVGGSLRHPGVWDGPILALCILVVAAAEAAVALALVLNLYHQRQTTNLHDTTSLKG